MILTTGTNVTVTTPGTPNFLTPPPTRTDVLVAPITGPPGPPGGATEANDQAVAGFIADPDSATRTALPPVIELVIEPEVNLSVLLENVLT